MAGARCETRTRDPAELDESVLSVIVAIAPEVMNTTPPWCGETHGHREVAGVGCETRTMCPAELDESVLSVIVAVPPSAYNTAPAPILVSWRGEERKSSRGGRRRL